MSEHDQTHYFIVTSHGWSASNWLSYVLNLHAEISCAHSSAAVVADDPALQEDGLRALVPRLRRGYLERQSRPIRDLYAELAATAPARYVGTVHTLRMRDLPIQERSFPLHGTTFRSVNLIRHPLDLVVSGYGQFKELFRIDLNEFSWTLAKLVRQGLDIVEDVCDRHQRAPGDFDSVCFFGACVVLGSLKLDLDAMPAVRDGEPWGFRGTVRMEDVTASPQAFSNLVGAVTGDPELADDAYLARVFATRPINTHNAAAPPTTAERWAGLQAWQQDAFRAFLERFELRAPYEGFGYDFAFLDA